MSNITYCANITCPMRSECKRGQKFPKSKSAEYFQHFEWRWESDYWNDSFGVTCNHQIKITANDTT